MRTARRTSMPIINKMLVILSILTLSVVQVNAQDIHEAAWHGDFEKVQELLKENPELLNARGPWGWTPLQRAVYFNHSNIVRFLISKGSDVNLTTPDGETALHWSLKCGHRELAKLLIRNNAVGDIQDQWGITPLQLTVENGYTEILRMLTERRMNLMVKEKHYGRTFLHLAAIHGHLDIVKMLIDQGLDVDAVDHDGNTPYYYSLKYGNKKIAQMLEERGDFKHRHGTYRNCSNELKKQLEAGEAIIWYLGSCGWAIKTQHHFLIFDYWEYGKRPAEPSLSNGHINPDDIKDLHVMVFVTHAHVDHYDPVIFDWEKWVDDITYVFGWKAKENPEYIYMVGPRAVEDVNGIDIYTINSHHVDVPEVAYLINVDGLGIYFNGDYSGEIRKDIDYIATKSDAVHLAFSEGPASVTSYMLETLEPAAWFPMHERGTEFKFKEFPQKVAEMNVATKVLCAENRGDRFYFKRGTIIQDE